MYKICQDCWCDENGDQYCPVLVDYDDCSVCGVRGFVAYVNVEDDLIDPLLYKLVADLYDAWDADCED